MGASGYGEARSKSARLPDSIYTDARGRRSTADYRNLPMVALAKTRARRAGVAPRVLNSGDGRLSPLDHASP